MLHATKYSGPNCQKNGNGDKRSAKLRTNQDCCNVAPNPARKGLIPRQFINLGMPPQW